MTDSENELHRHILEVIALIPFGKVATYGQIAKLAGLPKHVRLVGYVLKHIDAESQIPWFRVINSQGKLSVSRINDLGQNIQQDLLER
ncbi:MAG: MGMT family protein, partial [Acinetobacter sp.]